MFEITKQFRFESAHTLQRLVGTESSRRIHGHSYRAEVTLRGGMDGAGMVVDFGLFEKMLEETRDALDHRMLDDVEGLSPATMENISAFVWKKLQGALPQLYKVGIYRDSEGEACVYYGPNT